MIDELQARLAQLQQEYRTGEARLHDLVRQETALRETLLRISGAIQVLQEVLEPASVPAPTSALDRTPPQPAVDGVEAGGPRVLTVP